MDADLQARSRRRGIRLVRVVTLASVGGALGLVWGFGQLAEAYFSGKPAVVPPPDVPNQAAPVQKAPPVVVSVVHHSGPPPSSGGPRPPGQPPASTAAPPPPPACHSTPSKPC